MLDDVRVALGVSGSIAAVKTVELAHELRRQGAEVRAVMTDADRKSTRLNSSHSGESRMPSSA